MPAAKTKLLPYEDGNTRSFEFQGQAFYVKKKFKVGRFLKVLNDSPVDALEMVLSENSYENFLDLEITMDELKDFMETLSESLSGGALGN
jgi:hypothetical protein